MRRNHILDDLKIYENRGAIFLQSFTLTAANYKNKKDHTIDMFFLKEKGFVV